MEKFFNPQSVVVFGVSESPTNLAKNIVENLLEFGFKGIIYQVGRNEGTLYSRKIYKSVLEIDDPIDLAVILTPAPTIPAILEDCGKKGIRHVIIESAGFREYGEEGKKLETKIVKIANKYGIRFIGPNCIGTLDTHSGLATSFVGFKNVFKRGGISIATQSGGVGFSYLTILESENLGLSKFASIGNKLNLNENDLLKYYLSDPQTDIICLYLEGISEGRKLMETARTTHKPILVQKSNIGNHAKSISQSHTASLSSDDAVVSAALKQCGIARVTDRENLVNTLKVLPLPPMKGNRLAIISRSGGHAIVAADATESVGFELAPLSPALIKGIEKHLRGNVIKLTNPLDIGDLFDYDMYPQIVEKLLREKCVDGVVFMHAYFSALEGDKSRALFEKISQLSKKYQKPVGICVATDEDELNRLRKDVSYPIFGVPSAVIKALALSRDFYLRQQDKKHLRAVKEIKISPASKNKVAKILEKCGKSKRSPFLQEGMEIFSLYGIPIVKSVWVKNVNEATAAAKKVGYPVVVKIVSREISHKTDFGGVQLNLKSEDHVRDAYNEMITNIKRKAPKAKIEGVVVQPMLKRGWELILGAKQDPNFGPIVLAGLGGIFVEIFKDTSIRVCPFDQNEAAEMLTELKGYPILRGARGDKPYDIAVVENSILRLSKLIADFPEIKEIDINPFYVLHKGNARPPRLRDAGSHGGRGGFALDSRIIL